MIYWEKKEGNREKEEKEREMKCHRGIPLSFLSHKLSISLSFDFSIRFYVKLL